MKDSNKITKASIKKELRTHGTKFSKWVEAYLSPNSETKGNATQSALKHYNCKNYSVAGAIGSMNLKKLDNMEVYFDEIDGRGMHFWMNVLSTKALKGNYNETVDFMERLGYLPKKDAPENQLNQQFNFNNLAETFVQARKERGLPS